MAERVSVGSEKRIAPLSPAVSMSCSMLSVQEAADNSAAASRGRIPRVFFLLFIYLII